jgi:serine/threonine protein kinase
MGGSAQARYKGPVAPTDVFGESSAADLDSDSELEREVLESETISSSGDPEELISAMTRTLAPMTELIEAGGARDGEADEGTQVEIHNSGEPDDRSGECIHGRYQLVRQLGKGGMGTVYIARHNALPKTFAIKVLNPRYASRKDVAERFLQEAKAVSLIDHENVVGVVDFGREENGSAFLVMEHLRGETLSALCKREAPLPWARVQHIMAQLCRALQAAHAAGIVHRDIKPENVLRVGRHDDPDYIKVLDFGLAKLQVSGGLRLTQTGMVLGTPDYMSPEQARGRPTDHRTDIYASGVVMYELLCGRVPFQAKTFQAMRQKHLLEPPEPPSKWAPEAGITDEMDAIVLHALAKDPARRFTSMAKFGEAIAAVGTGSLELDELARHTMPLLAERSVLDSLGGTRPPRPPKPGLGNAAATQAGGSEPELSPATEEPALTSPRAGVGLGFVIVFVLAAVGALVALALGAFEGFGEPEIAQRAEAEGEAEEPPVGPEVPEARADEVMLRFETNVPLVVLDAEGRPVSGEEPTREIALPYSEVSRRLVLHADGYRDLHVVVTPDRDQILEATLEVQPEPADTEVEPTEQVEPEPEPEPVREKSKPRPANTPQPKPEPEPEPAPEPTQEANDAGHSFSPEIVDPFHKK